jgi:hypothetical protein
MGKKTWVAKRMIQPDAFPRLTPQNHNVTSPASIDYNCIAWAAGDTEHWWQPGKFWPVPVSQEDFGIAVLEGAYKALGYWNCAMDTSLEPGFQKVALFGAVLYYTHPARQLPNGRWTSKLGKAEDIEHENAQDVGGGIYGEIVAVLKRPVNV